MKHYLLLGIILFSSAQAMILTSGLQKGMKQFITSGAGRGFHRTRQCNKYDGSKLHQACQQGDFVFVEKFLNKLDCADTKKAICSLDEDGNSLLTSAVLSGNPETVELLWGRVSAMIACPQDFIDQRDVQLAVNGYLNFGSSHPERKQIIEMILKLAGTNAPSFVLGTQLPETESSERSEILRMFFKVLSFSFPQSYFPEDRS